MYVCMYKFCGREFSVQAEPNGRRKSIGSFSFRTIEIEIK
jgi:hypothetical protein